MRYLAIETSDPRGSLALFDENRVLAEEVFPEGLVHAREFASRLESLLTAEGLRPEDLDGVAVSAGPGSYTGCRVGVTAAKSLSFALGIPVLALSSLEVLAAQALSLGEESGEVRHLAPVLDGRRGFFYAALFTVDDADRPRRVLEDQVAQAEDVAAALGAAIEDEADRQGAWLFGEGADAFLERVGVTFWSRGPSLWDAPRASVLAHLALSRMGESISEPEAIHQLAPAYLRPSEPEIVYERRQAEKRDGSEAAR